MRQFKKRMLANGLALSLVLSSLPTTYISATEKNNVKFSDVKGHWSESFINDFTNRGYINGYGDGTFRPNSKVTRAEFVKIVNKTFGFTQKGNENFSDVNKDDWYYDEVLKAVKQGYIQGYGDGTFRPNDKITREEACKIIGVILKVTGDGKTKFKDEKEIANWAIKYVDGLVDKGIIHGYEDNTFKPKNNATRAESVKTLYGAKDKYNSNEDVPPVINPNPPITPEIPENNGPVFENVDYSQPLDPNGDEDEDGINNGEEEKLGTDPYSIDTDRDSIDDFEEINTYKTNPLNSDTDGDGMIDGYEVILGLDPKQKNEEKESYNLSKQNNDLGINIDIEGNLNAVASTKIMKIEDEYFDSLIGKVGDIINIKSDEKLTNLNINFKYDKLEIQQKKLNEDNLNIFLISDDNLDLIKLDSKIDKENNIVTSQINFNKRDIDIKKVFRIILGDSEKLTTDLSKLDIIFALDHSGSMGPHEDNGEQPGNDPDFERCEVTKDLIENLNGDYRFGLIKFDGVSTTLNELTDNKENLYKELDNLKNISLGQNGTNIKSPIDSAISLLKDSNNRKILVLLADGDDNRNSKNNIIKSAQSAYNDYNIQIYTVGLGENIESDILKDIAHETNGRYLESSKADDLKEEFKNLTSTIKPSGDKVLIASNGFGINNHIPFANYTIPNFIDKKGKPLGQCYGMAITSILTYENRLPVEVKKSMVEVDPYKITNNDYLLKYNKESSDEKYVKNIKQCIAWWWNTQRNNILPRQNKIRTIESLKNDINSGPLLITFDNGNIFNYIGHAVVGQKLYKDSKEADKYYIEIYDNNYPKETRKIVVEEKEIRRGENYTKYLVFDADVKTWEEHPHKFFEVNVDDVYNSLKNNGYF